MSRTPPKVGGRSILYICTRIDKIVPCLGYVALNIHDTHGKEIIENDYGVDPNVMLGHVEGEGINVGILPMTRMTNYHKR